MPIDTFYPSDEAVAANTREDEESNVGIGFGDSSDLPSGDKWRPLIGHSQSVPFWLFLLRGRVRWRLPREQAAGEEEQGAHKYLTLQARAIYARADEQETLTALTLNLAFV